jgi:hypothetical protein
MARALIVRGWSGHLTKTIALQLPGSPGFCPWAKTTSPLTVLTSVAAEAVVADRLMTRRETTTTIDLTALAGMHHSGG